MSLDEAIRYYSRLADECRRKANIERYDYMDLKDLAAEHGQLADWLNELKALDLDRPQLGLRAFVWDIEKGI